MNLVLSELSQDCLCCVFLKNRQLFVVCSEEGSNTAAETSPFFFYLKTRCTVELKILSKNEYIATKSSILQVCATFIWHPHLVNGIAILENVHG